MPRGTAGKLAVTACGEPRAAGAEFDRQGAALAQVSCASDERVANHPVRLRHECRLAAGSWTCQPRGKSVELELNGRRVTLDFPVELDSWSAWRMAQAIGPAAVPLAAASGARGAGERCALSGDDSDSQVSRMTLRCRLWTVEFVKLCQEGACRYEPAAIRGSDRVTGRGNDQPRRDGPPR